MKRIALTLLIAIIGGLIGVGMYKLFEKDEHLTFEEKQKVQFASLPAVKSVDGPGIDFTVAAARTTPAVVHIKVTMAQNPQADVYDPFRDFFGDRGFRDFFGDPRFRGPSVGSGSGVIISADGYIVTNNHVIRDAEKIEVILNDKRSYSGKVIGTDPNTDLALIRIDEKNLPFVVYGNSDEVRIGEWVLAVGNPFNLTSTVTAGIVSAKGRNINILDNDPQRNLFPIESFIQTDAAVNPGNSGGALVNTNGELIGINTAIASQTGTYAGYAFAVPVNLVKKVMDDLLEYGEVQRAFLGIEFQEVDSKLASEKDLSSVRGVYVTVVREGGAAEVAGVKQGDVILRVGGVNINTGSDLLEQVARHRPGDEIDVVVERDNRERTLRVILRNRELTTGVVKKERIEASTLLGASFQSLSPKEKKDLKLESGIKIASLKAGKLSAVGIREGFIITRLDNKPVNSTEDLTEILSAKQQGMLMVEGVYPGNSFSKYIYSFNIGK